MLLAGNNNLSAAPRISQAGFTLVEMMTVLVIIGLMSSAVILTLPQNKPAIDTQSETLLRGVNVMAQSSLISGTPSALGLSENQYAFMEYIDGEWEAPVSIDFTNGVRAVLQKDGADIKLSDDIQPLIMFEANGLSTPFSLTLSDSENTATLRSVGDGRVMRGSAP